MALFPQISPVLDRSSDSITDMIMSLPDLLPPHLYQPYRDYCRSLQESPDTTAVITLLQNYCLHALILQARIMHYDALVFKFGIEVLPWNEMENPYFLEAIDNNTNNEPDLPAGLAYIQREFPYNDSSLIVDLVVLRPLRRMCANLLDYELQPMIRSHFQNQPGILNRPIYNQVSILQRFAREVLLNEVSGDRPVTISHFRFQNMHRYLEHTGEHATPELLGEIIVRLKSILKQTDSVYQLSPESYIVISPGASERVMQDRFKNLYFQIRSIILEYTLDILTVDKLPLHINEIWKALRI